MEKSPIQVVQQNLFDIEPLQPEPKHHQKEEDDFVFDSMDALQGTILTFSLHWADIIPQRILELLPMSRLIALMRGEHLATYEECVVYIYTRVHEAPMEQDWTDIYTHVSCTVLENHFGEDHWQHVSAPRKLSVRLQGELDDLRSRIYRKRREILKQQWKTKVISETTAPAETPRPKSKSTPKPGQGQQSMF